jgi:polyisoprenoid-binding protein YceI
MWPRARSWIGAGVLCGAAFSIGAAKDAEQTKQHWVFDADTARLKFQVAILGVLEKQGQFDRFEGQLIVTHRLAYVVLDIDARSARMKKAKDTATVQGEAYFAAEAHPHIHYQSAAFDAALLRLPDATHQLPGTLSLRGQTNKEQIELKVIDCPSQALLSQCRFEVRASISRKRYGMKSHRAFVADKVGLHMELSGAKLETR